ncbi:MAG: hypothetical protein IJ968_05480 [Clostridia bacterium]|nr:hypothetical protein [Clostridia bacterium]
MNIQFSQNQARQACHELEDQTTNIKNGANDLMSAIESMKSAWTGTAADATIDSVVKNSECLQQVEDFVKFLGDHIDQCRMNYNFTERVNADILQSISEMFL